MGDAKEESEIRVEVIDAARRMVHIGSFSLPMRLDDRGIGMVEAGSVGAWAGFSRPRDARKLAMRLRRDGIINDYELRAIVAQSTGGRPSQEVWLTRAGALKLVARSDAPKAPEVLDLLVQAFEAMLDGLISVRYLSEMGKDRIESALGLLADAIVANDPNRTRDMVVSMLRQEVFTHCGVSGLPIDQVEGTDLNRVVRLAGKLTVLLGTLPAARRPKRRAKTRALTASTAATVTQGSFEFVVPAGHQVRITAEPAA